MSLALNSSGYLSALLLAQCMAVLMAQWLPAPAPWGWCALLAACAFPRLACRGRWLSVGLAGLCSGLSWAGWHGQNLIDARLSAECERVPLYVEGQVVDLPRSGGVAERSWQRFRLRVQQVLPSECAGPRLALLTLYAGPALQPGERWAFQITPRVPWGQANPAGFDAAAWYAREGIDMLGTVRAASARRLAPAHGMPSLHQRLRLQLVARITEHAPSERAAALLRALVVGDRGGMDEALWRQLQTWGISHLLVISGLHIALVAGAGLLLGRLLAHPLALAGWAAAGAVVPALLSLAAALLYTALAGFSAPTVRALCMAACFLLAGLLGRRGRSWRNLLLAVWCLLLLNPLQVLGAGFWLSAGAVAALLWVLGWGAPRQAPRRALRIHAYMSLAMLPLTAWWFQGGSLLGLPANLVAVPLVSLWVAPLALLGALCVLPWPGLAELLWQLGSWPLLGLLDVGAWLEQGGSDSAYLFLNPSILGVCCALAAVVLQALPLPLLARVASLALFMPLFLADRSAPDWLAQVTVLDVGQGTAVVLRTASQTLVYDTGGGDPQGPNHGTRSVIPFLRQQGVRRIDDLVISHADTDHSAGAAALLAQFPVRRVHLGEPLPVAPQGHLCRAGRRWQWAGGLRLSTLNAGRPSTLRGNAASCVLMIEVAGRRFLLTGDLDAAGERELALYWGEALRADWLLVGHHGSATSTSSAFLRAVRPQHAVLSYARANPFGHPHPGVMQRLARSAATVRSTAQHGALHYRIYPDGHISLHAQRERYRPYWASAGV